MPESHTLVESQRYVLELTDSQAVELQRLREVLQSSQKWWGSVDDLDDLPSRSPVHISPRGRNRYEVSIQDSIGALALPNMSLVVVPKIREDHFIYIAARALGYSRADASALSLKGGSAFKDLVAGWFVSSVESLVRTGLNVDYRSVVAEESILRGALRIEPTMRRWMTGRIDLVCQFDELSIDTALNRVVKAALQGVGESRVLSREVARRARLLSLWFRPAGNLRPSDVQVDPTRGERRYRRPLELARSVLASTGRSLHHGSEASSTFLYRTPDLMEEGIRNILMEALRPIKVQKHGRVLVPSAERVMPDLELATPPFTGDVKYKISRGKWNRPDLAQAVLFAAAYRSPRALVLGFRQEEHVALGPVPVGDIEVVSALWDASGLRPPGDAERQFVRAVRRFLPEQVI